MSRERQVLKEARNGGAACPEVVQRRGCNGANCEVANRAALKASRGKCVAGPCYNLHPNLETRKRLPMDLLSVP